jgi:hypothetical protein
VVNHGVVSSWSADSRRAIAHESGCPIGFPNVAQTMNSAHCLVREICYVAAGRPGNLESLTRALRSIRLALPRFVNLSNWAAREFDVSLGPDGGRKIVSKMCSGDELGAWRRADANIGDLASPGRVAEAPGPERCPGMASIVKSAN